jgi:hypothetical protein
MGDPLLFVELLASESYPSPLGGWKIEVGGEKKKINSRLTRASKFDTLRKFAQDVASC